MTSPKIQLNELVKPHWTEDDNQKASLAVKFVQLLMNDHNFDEVLANYGKNGYKQHNQTIADGIEGVISAIRTLTKNAPEFSYDVKNIFVDGNYVILHSHVTLKAKHRNNPKQGFNIIDTWKIENNDLVEHWDAVQGISFSMRLYTLLTGGKILNKNGIF
ncbi:nuclear transport factor 2 family protein [Pseudoalteromonas phenolica]|uniref:Polyketide cyclase n=1 Tax=Pseudoalteromonas phenolica TaxID=161398 RepID=A0A0S2K1K8_9GAMM|nr:nuclear transport factor 2 family protein [Pseudoalteromonas phenolica]ALO41950.1 Polyketide cyclase [Pseudoalteromonas phenolica]MBE0353487.1 hypothetical protein [Pseudoalteromonas phenolica O-BC30]RXE94913.1 polyketide cyclase [Pseudoalteromonas phenolica O-BC30]